MLINSVDDYTMDKQVAATGPSIQQNLKQEKTMDAQGSYVIHMMKALQEKGISKHEIAEKMRISLATFYRVQSGDTKLLNYGNFRRLLYFYCWKALCPEIQKEQ